MIHHWLTSQPSVAVLTKKTVDPDRRGPKPMCLARDVNVRHYHPHFDVTVVRPGDFVLMVRDLLASLVTNLQTKGKVTQL